MAERRVLLLGEGNFSFAAALCEAAGTRVVATCYEREEEVAARGRAAESIRRLRERGGWAPRCGASRVPCAARGGAVRGDECPTGGAALKEPLAELCSGAKGAWALLLS